MSEIVYNGIKLKRVLTESVDQVAIAEPNGSHVLSNKTTIRVIGIAYTLSGGQVGDVGIQYAAAPPTWAKPLIDALSEPKKRFIYTLAGVRVWDVSGESQDAGNDNSTLQDLENGPRTNAEFIHIIDSHSIRVRFTITFNSATCHNKESTVSANAALAALGPDATWADLSTAVSGAVTHLRFNQSEDLNRNWITTREYTGQIRVSRRDISVFFLRSLVLPPLQRTFRREVIRLVESEDGLSLSFTIRDMQKHASAPLPATDWRGTHATTWSNGSSVIESEVSATFVGHLNANRARLAWLAWQVVWEKLYFSDLANKQSNFLKQLRLGSSLAENEISINASVRHNNPSQSDFQFKLANAFKNPTKFFPSYNKDLHYQPISSASLAGLFQQALMQGACNQDLNPWSRPLDKNVVQTYSPGDGQSENQPTDPSSAGSIGDLWKEDTQTITQASDFTHFYVSHEYNWNTGHVTLPVAYHPQGAKSVSVQLHQAFGNRIVQIEAERIGAWPELPSLKSFKDENGILYTPKQYNPILNNPITSADGLKVMYSSKVEIEYSCDRVPTEANDKWIAGISPFLKNDPNNVIHFIDQNSRKDPKTQYKAIQ